MTAAITEPDLDVFASLLSDDTCQSKASDEGPVCGAPAAYDCLIDCTGCSNVTSLPLCGMHAAQAALALARGCTFVCLACHALVVLRLVKR